LFQTIRQKICLRSALYSYPRYQPVLIRGRFVGGNERNCFDRWEVIRKEIETSGGSSVLDIGSAEGFYVIQAARECSCTAIGVEMDARRFAVAEDQIIKEKIRNARFIFGAADTEMIPRLPASDLVICMSVLHHIMSARGEEYARGFMSLLRKRTKKEMIFEMGQSDESELSWAKRLPDMGDRPHEWIESFLKSCGFSVVEKIAEVDSYKKDKKRALFRLIP